MTGEVRLEPAGEVPPASGAGCVLALIASAFFWSKQGRVGFTLTHVEGPRPSVESEDVDVGLAAPAEKREIVQQTLGRTAVAVVQQIRFGITLDSLLPSPITGSR